MYAYTMLNFGGVSHTPTTLCLYPHLTSNPPTLISLACLFTAGKFEDMGIGMFVKQASFQVAVV